MLNLPFTWNSFKSFLNPIIHPIWSWIQLLIWNYEFHPLWSWETMNFPATLFEMITIFNFDPLSPNFLRSRSPSVKDYENSMLTPLLQLSTSHHINLANPIPVSKNELSPPCISSQKFDPTLSQIGRHATKSCSFHFGPVFPLEYSCIFKFSQFFHLKIFAFPNFPSFSTWILAFPNFRSLSSDDWAELGGIVRRHLDREKALQQVQKISQDFNP